MDIKGPKLHTIGEAHILSSMDLTNENSFESPMAISPVMEQVKNTGGKVNISLKENSLMVVKFKTKKVISVFRTLYKESNNYIYFAKIELKK